MAERSYVDFDLQIEWVGTGYRARVLDSPAGQAQADVSVPFTDLEIENFVLRVGQRRRGSRRVESQDLNVAREFGSTLFQAMLRDDIASAYRASLAWAQEHESGLRVRLRLSGAPDLVEIPWEFLYDPTARRFVALSADSPIVRFLDVPGATTPLKISTPIKILAVISSPTDFEPLQVEDEWARLQEAVSSVASSGLLSLERLEKATLSELQRALRKDYNVLHFVGHGGFDEKGDDGFLVFEDEQGRGNEVSASYLSTLLHDADTLRLAVLNACDGARSSRADQFAGVAQSLLQQGVPAVVAMQFEISDEAALNFAREFYRSFAEGYPVEAALAEARKSMFAQSNDSEWATPVLYLRAAGSLIFQIEQGTAQPPPQPPEATVPERVPVPVPVPLSPPHRSAQSTSAETDPQPVAETEPLRELAPSVGPAIESSSGAGSGGGPRRPWKKIGLGAGGFAAAGIALGAILFLGNGDDPGLPEPTPTATIAGVFPPLDYSGTWYTNFADIELEQDGTVAKGTYRSFLGGSRAATISGDVNGGNLVGTFNGSTDPFAFTMNKDGVSFSGYWVDRNGGRHEWCGQRDSELEEGCGYTGSWKVKGFPSPVDSSVIWMTQTEDLVVMEVSSTRYGETSMAMHFDPAKLASASGRLELDSSLRYDFHFDLVDEVNWNAITGTWKPVSPNTGPEVKWCAWRGTEVPPC